MPAYLHPDKIMAVESAMKRRNKAAAKRRIKKAVPSPMMEKLTRQYLR